MPQFCSHTSRERDDVSLPLLDSSICHTVSFPSRQTNIFSSDFKLSLSLFLSPHDVYIGFDVFLFSLSFFFFSSVAAFFYCSPHSYWGSLFSLENNNCNRRVSRQTRVDGYEDMHSSARLHWFDQSVRQWVNWITHRWEYWRWQAAKEIVSKDILPKYFIEKNDENEKKQLMCVCVYICKNNRLLFVFFSPLLCCPVVFFFLSFVQKCLE